MASAPTSVHDHAAGNLRLIRAAMERAGRFTAVPGWGGVVMGLVGAGAAYVAAAQNSEAWLRTWLIAAGVAVPIGAASLLRAAQSTGVDLTTGVARRFVLGLLMPIGGGAVLTLAAIQRQTYDLLPVIWLTLYGVAILVAGAVSIRLVSMTGLAFLVLGTVAALTPVGSATDWLMGLGFGGIHIAAGLTLVLLRSREKGR